MALLKIETDMYKLLFVILTLFTFCTSLTGQKYFTKTGSIHFLSEAPLEKIESTNNNAYVVFDAASGQIEWSVLIKGFKFAKALMQEHFNENYMESDQYPKAFFKGTINQKGFAISRDGSYDVLATGNITIHGVTKPFSTPGRIMVKNGKINTNSSFTLTIADFNISVPKVVRDNISKTVRVTVNADLQSLE